MRAAFPDSTVTGYEHLVDAMTTDPKDRHVAAAAVVGGAALIVTANTRDFPGDALAPYNIHAAHPDEFLQDQLDLAPAVTLESLRRQRAEYTRPQFTFTEFYMTMAMTVPGFAAQAAAAEQDSLHSEDGLAPLEIVSSEAALQAFFPDQAPDPSEALGAAFLWWSALIAKSEMTDVLHALTWHAPAWGDYEWAEQLLAGAGMMQFVERSPTDDDIAYVKFMPHADHAMRAFGDMHVSNARILTMIRCPDGCWRAWGLGIDRFPSAAEVRGDTAGG